MVQAVWYCIQNAYHVEHVWLSVCVVGLERNLFAQAKLKVEKFGVDKQHGALS